MTNNPTNSAAAARPNRPTTPDFPSRHTNPFATCWTYPGALPFHFADGQTAEQLVARLASQSWRGAILGPHGSGKSTLLASLIPLLEATGICVISITPRKGQRQLPSGLIASLGKARAEDRFLTPDAAGAAPPRCVVGSQCPHQILVIDGYEQLAWLDRWRMKCHCRRLEVGLLITSHTAGGLPTLIK
ncbi:MAG: hypothetical protein L0Z07_07235, partial [Planctomycetes bacterium]|nr:hypothetical protein [Planctomycetota bacterium]